MRRSKSDPTTGLAGATSRKSIIRRSVRGQRIEQPDEPTPPPGVPLWLHRRRLQQKAEENLDANLVEEEKKKGQQNADKKRAIRAARERKWRGKKCLMLSGFILATILGVGCLTKWGFQAHSYSVPPSDYAEESNENALSAFVGLVIVAPIGFCILAFRVSNLFIGLLFMFVIVMVMAFGMTSVSRAIYSFKRDTFEGTMRLWTTKFYKKSENQALPDFYDKLQKSCECCGFGNMDRIEDWPMLLESDDLPPSCCQPSKLRNKYGKDPNKDETLRAACKGLGRMRTVSTRVPSGFGIIALDSDMKVWKDESKGQKPEEYKHVISLKRQMMIDDAETSVIQKIFGEYASEANKKWKITEKPYLTKNGTLALNATFPHEVELRFDELAEELVYSGEVKRGEWVYFEIPLDDPNLIPANKQDIVADPSISPITTEPPTTTTKLSPTFPTPPPDPVKRRRYARQASPLTCCKLCKVWMKRRKIKEGTLECCVKACSPLNRKRRWFESDPAMVIESEREIGGPGTELNEIALLTAEQGSQALEADDCCECTEANGYRKWVGNGTFGKCETYPYSEVLGVGVCKVVYHNFKHPSECTRLPPPNHETTTTEPSESTTGTGLNSECCKLCKEWAINNNLDPEDPGDEHQCCNYACQITAPSTRTKVAEDCCICTKEFGYKQVYESDSRYCLIANYNNVTKKCWPTHVDIDVTPWRKPEECLTSVPTTDLSTESTTPISTAESTKSYYVTQGIPENILMDKVVWRNRCDRGVNPEKTLEFKTTSCSTYRHNPDGLFKQDISQYRAWKHEFSSRGNSSFFHAVLKRIMIFDCILSSGIIVISFVLFVLFWYFYSRLMGEELADLTLPSDFELLNMDVPDADLDESSRQLEEQLLKLRLKEMHDRVARQEEENKGDQRRGRQSQMDDYLAFRAEAGVGERRPSIPPKLTLNKARPFGSYSTKVHPTNLRKSFKDA